MPGAEDSVVLKLKVELEESEKAFKDYKTKLAQLKREKTKDNKAERVDLQRRVNEESKLHKTKLNQIKELRAARRIENSVWLKDLSKIPEQLGQKYQAWARRNPEAAAMFRGVRTAGKVIGRPAMAAARLGAGVAASGISGLLGMLIGGIQQGYQTYLQVGQAMGGVAGMGAGRGLNKAIGRGIGLGHRPSETWMQAAQVGRATGAPEAVTLAQKFALHGGGMQVGEAAGIMGQLRQAGVEFNEGNRPGASSLLGKMIEKGLITGLEKARLPEYLKGVSSMAEMVGGRQAGKVDVDTIATTLSYLGRIPGMQGQRGVSLMQTIDQAIKSPGGGEAGQQLMLQAMGFGKPGGETPYYEAVKRQQRGITGIGGAQNLIDVFKEIQAQYGPLGKGSQSQEANLAMQTAMPGLTLDMIESIGEMINSGKSQEEILKGIEEQTKKFKPVEERVVDAIDKGFLSVRVRLAGQEAKSAKIGAESASLVEQVQDLHHKLLRELIGIMKDHLPAIKTILSEVGNVLIEILKAFGKGSKAAAPAIQAAATAFKTKGSVREKTVEAVAEYAVASKRKAREEKIQSRIEELRKEFPDYPESRLEMIAREERELGSGGGPRFRRYQELRRRPLSQLEKIEKLKEEGKHEEARKMLEEMQKPGGPLGPAAPKTEEKGKASPKEGEKEGEKGASLNPETGADPFVPGGVGRLASLAQTGPAGVRTVEGRIILPIPYHPEAEYKGAPGGGKGSTRA